MLELEFKGCRLGSKIGLQTQGRVSEKQLSPAQALNRRILITRTSDKKRKPEVTGS